MRQEEGREHERLDGHELDQDVVGRPGRVLQRVADGVANDGRPVALGALAAKRAGVLARAGLRVRSRCGSVRGSTLSCKLGLGWDRVYPGSNQVWGSLIDRGRDGSDRVCAD